MALCFAAGAKAAAPASERLWLGEFRIGGEATALLLHDRTSSKDAASTIDLPAKGTRDQPLSAVSMSATRAQFALQAGQDLLQFDGVGRDGRISGHVQQDKKTGEFTLVQTQSTDLALVRRLAGSYQIADDHIIDLGPMDEHGGMLVFIDHKTLREGPLYALSATQFVSGPTLGIPYPFVIQVEFVSDAKGQVTELRWSEAGKQVSAKKIAPHRVEEVSVRNGDVTLKGILSVPASAGPHPAIVFAHGSGDSTRNVGMWNSFFVRLGFAVLSLDKRGAGESSGDWKKASLDEIANDWLAGVAMLKQRADIDPRRIGVHGSSQGGWTAPLMAAHSSDVSFLIVRAGPGVSVADTMAHEIGWSVREAGLTEADAKAAEAASLRLFELSAADWQTFDAFATPLKSKSWADYAWPMHMSKAGWGRQWIAMNAPYDPAGTLAKIKVPVLWFLGDLDHNVPTDASEQALNAARKSSGNKDFSIVRLANAGHGFTQSNTGNNKDFVSQTHMVAGYWDAIETWLEQRVLRDNNP